MKANDIVQIVSKLALIVSVDILGYTFSYPSIG